MSKCPIDSKIILAKNEKNNMKGHAVVNSKAVPTIERYVHGANQKLLADIVTEKSNSSCKKLKTKLVDVKKKTPIQVARDLMRANPKYAHMTDAEMDDTIKSDPQNPFNRKVAFSKSYITNPSTGKKNTTKKAKMKCAKTKREKITRKKQPKIARNFSDEELIILKKKLPKEDKDGNSEDSCQVVQEVIDKYIDELYKKTKSATKIQSVTRGHQLRHSGKKSGMYDDTKQNKNKLITEREKREKFAVQADDDAEKARQSSMARKYRYFMGTDGTEYYKKKGNEKREEATKKDYERYNKLPSNFFLASAIMKFNIVKRKKIDGMMPYIVLPGEKMKNGWSHGILKHKNEKLGSFDEHYYFKLDEVGNVSEFKTGQEYLIAIGVTDGTVDQLINDFCLLRKGEDSCNAAKECKYDGKVCKPNTEDETATTAAVLPIDEKEKKRREQHEAFKKKEEEEEARIEKEEKEEKEKEEKEKKEEEERIKKEKEDEEKLTKKLKDEEAKRLKEMAEKKIGKKMADGATAEQVNQDQKDDTLKNIEKLKIQDETLDKQLKKINDIQTDIVQASVTAPLPKIPGQKEQTRRKEDIPCKDNQECVKRDPQFPQCFKGSCVKPSPPINASTQETADGVEEENMPISRDVVMITGNDNEMSKSDADIAANVSTDELVPQLPRVDTNSDEFDLALNKIMDEDAGKKEEIVTPPTVELTPVEVFKECENVGGKDAACDDDEICGPENKCAKEDSRIQDAVAQAEDGDMVRTDTMPAIQPADSVVEEKEEEDPMKDQLFIKLLNFMLKNTKVGIKAINFI